MSVSENLFQAIDTIISQRINEVSFDRTLICEIVSDSQHEKGEYTVKQDARKFVAYASGTERYRVGQQVYVTIPQGNYDLKKVIIGRYSADDINPYQYSSPMDAMLVMEVFDKFEDSFDSLMVAPSSVDKTFAEDSLVTLEGSIVPPPANQEQEFGKLHYFGFEGVFTTTLESTEGNYGVTIHFNENEQPDLVFDSSEFLGNPYWFDGGFKVQKIFDYDLSNVTSVRIKLYQGGNFNDDLTEDDKIITLSNVKLYFGYDQKEFAAAAKGSEKVFTIVEEKLAKQEYYGGQANDIEISAIYITKQGERYVREEIPAGVTWYRFYNGSEDFGAGNGWAKILNQTAGTLTNDQVWTIQLKQGDEEVSTTTEFPEVLNRTERICAMYEGTLSNVLEYTLAASQTSGSEQAGAGNSNLPSITINLINDEYNGIYNLYGNDNKLIPRTFAPRTLVASYDNKVEWGQNGETVTWEFPAIGSMIKAPDLGTLNGYDDEGNPQTSPWSIETIKDLDEQPIKYLVTWIKEADIEGSRRIQFQLADSYLPNYTNNTIKCITTTGQIKQWGEKQLLFGLANTAGSGYAFNINLDKQVLGPEGGIRAYFTLHNPSGLDISNSPSIDPLNIEWSWFQSGYWNDIATPFDIVIEGEAGSTETFEGKEIYYIDPQTKQENQDWQIGTATGQRTKYLNGEEIVGELITQTEDYFEYDVLPDEMQAIMSQSDWDGYKQGQPKTEYTRILGKSVIIKFPDGLEDLENYKNFNILQAQLQDWSTEAINKDIQLIDYKTIPCTNKNDQTSVTLQGATRVVYDTSGVNASYDKNIYKLFNSDLQQIPAEFSLRSTKPKDRSLPVLSYATGEEGYRLKPISPKPTTPPPCMIECEVEDMGIWQYPILITQNAYASDLLNAWDGSLKIDAEGNSILSALMGAGTKDDQNRFTGVLMGTIGDTIWGAKTGLYGLKDGARAFELNEKGEFYVGDGNDYLQFNKDGLKVQLGKGSEFHVGIDNNYLSFDGAQFNLRTNNFKLESPQFVISSKTSKLYGLASWTQDTTNSDGTPTKEDVCYTSGMNGLYRNVSSDKIFLWAGDRWSRKPSQGSDSYRNQIAEKMEADSWSDVYEHILENANFYVTHDGKMFAKAGQIAGWNITSGKLYAGDATRGLGLVLQTNSANPYAIAAGATSHSDYSNAKFRVKHTGEFYATAGEISGNITIGGGVKIGGASLTASDIDTFVNIAAGKTTGTDWKIKHIEADSGKIGGWTIAKEQQFGPDPRYTIDSALYAQNQGEGIDVAIAPEALYLWSQEESGSGVQQISWLDFAHGKTGIATTLNGTSVVYLQFSHGLLVNTTRSESMVKAWENAGYDYF